MHSQWRREGLWRPGSRIIFGAPIQTSNSSETVSVARFVKRGKTACASPTLFLLLPANCVFKLTRDAPSTVKYENWHVFNMLIITDRNPHFKSSVQAGYVAAFTLIAQQHESFIYLLCDRCELHIV